MSDARTVEKTVSRAWPSYDHRVRCHRRRGLRRCRLDLVHIFDDTEHEIGRRRVPLVERERLTAAEADDLRWFLEHSQTEDALEYLAIKRDIQRLQGGALLRATAIVFALCALSLIVLIGLL